MFRAHSAHHQERQIVPIQAQVTVILWWWPRSVQVGRSYQVSLLPTCTHLGHHHRMTVTRGCIDTICLSWRWALCAWNIYRVINRNKHIEKNLSITLVIYKEAFTLLGSPYGMNHMKNKHHKLFLEFFFLLHMVGVSAHIHVYIHPCLEWDPNSEPVVCAIKIWRVPLWSAKNSRYKNSIYEC